MAYEVHKVQAFEKATADSPGQLAVALRPLAAAGINLDHVWGWTEGPGTAKVRVALCNPTAKDKKALASAGFAPVPGSAICVAGPNKVGAGQELGAVLGAAGLSMDALAASAIGPKACAIAFFKDPNAGPKAAKVIAAAGKKPPAKKAAAGKAAGKATCKTNSGSGEKMTPAKKAAPKKAPAKKAPPKKTATKKK